MRERDALPVHTPEAFRPRGFVCPSCGRVADAAIACPACGTTTRAADRLPTRAVAADRRRFDVHRWFLGGTAVVLAPLSVLCALAPAPFAGFLMMPALAIAIVVGGKTGQAIGRRRLRESLVAWAAAEFARDPSMIRDAPEGRARVSGVAVPVTLVRSPSGVACVAYERRGALYDGDFSIAGAGGVFELDDGSGTRARVHAEHVIVLGGNAMEPELRVMAGARIEVVGDARWVAASGDHVQSGGLRSASRMLDVTGSTQHPVLVRVLSDGAAQLPPG